MKINWLRTLGWVIVVSGFVAKFAHFSLFNIPYFGTLVTFLGVAIIYFDYEENKKDTDNENT